MRATSLLLVFALLTVGILVSADQSSSSGESLWIQPAFVEEGERQLFWPDNVPNPAEKVDWLKPRIEDIDHRDHQRVHTTLMAGHLDIATGFHRRGDGVKVKQHVKAAQLHDKAAGLHEQANEDTDFIKDAIKASKKAYAKSRSLVRRVKKPNMVPDLQLSPEAEAALVKVQKFNPQLAPESLQERQFRRSIGKDLALMEAEADADADADDMAEIDADADADDELDAEDEAEAEAEDADAALMELDADVDAEDDADAGEQIDADADEQ